MYQTNYLAHYGIKGMKWGVRRYQNEDGSYTDKGRKRYAKQIEKYEKWKADQRDKDTKRLVKELKAEYKRGQRKFIGQPARVTDAYNSKMEDAIKKVITDDDKKRIKKARDAYLYELIEVDKVETKLYDIVEKHAKEFYDREIKAHPYEYTTPREKEKLREFSYFDYAWGKVRGESDELDKAEKRVNKYEDAYMRECEKVTNKMLGKYGETKLHKSKYYTLDIAKTANSTIRNMSTMNEL